MKKIVLIGLVSNHHSLYQYLLQIFIKEFGSVSFITRNEIYSQISLPIDNVIIDNSRPDKVFKNNISLINEHDILITDEYFGSFVRMGNVKFFNKKRVIIVHNANRWVSKITTPLLHPKLFVDQLFKNQFKNQMDAFITLGPNIERFIRPFMLNKKNVFWVPFDIANKLSLESSKKQKNDDLILLVPGTISNLRRNYKDLLWAINKYYEKNDHSKIKFTFLGKIVRDSDSFVADQCKTINTVYGNKIKYWEYFINADEFEKEVLSADFILSNIYPTTTSKGITETYGITKESGVSYILYKYSKSGIVPSFQKILEGFDSQLIRFNGYSGLITVLEQIERGLVNSRKLSHEALINTERFNSLIEKETKKLIEYIKG